MAYNPIIHHKLGEAICTKLEEMVIHGWGPKDKAFSTFDCKRSLWQEEVK